MSKRLSQILFLISLLLLSHVARAQFSGGDLGDLGGGSGTPSGSGSLPSGGTTIPSGGGASTPEYCGDGQVNGTEQCDGAAGITDPVTQTCTSGCTIQTTVEEGYCGDNSADSGEECDDGNTDDGDGCSATCVGEYCGDGVINDSGVEDCDDNNTVDGDGCSAACIDEYCGDGVKNDDGAEQCDGTDGVTDTSTQGCTNECVLYTLTVDEPESCGDGIKNGSEECDGSDGVDTTAHEVCTASCEIIVRPYCGDGVKNGIEECDGSDGADDANHEVCSASCRVLVVPYCGDGTQNGSEQCDGSDGIADSNTQSCTDQCLLITVENNPTDYCGDNNTDSDEECDDGNDISGDGCDSQCRNEFCGDGDVNDDGAEACDDGNANDGDGCTAFCIEEFCGDGIKNDDGAEACDGDDGADTLLRQSCDSDCVIITAAFCGDGAQDDDEECDDGNGISTDACDNECVLTFCGDGVKNDAEDCDGDDGIDTALSESCADDCTITTPTYCGDGTEPQSALCAVNRGSAGGMYCEHEGESFQQLEGSITAIKTLPDYKMLVATVDQGVTLLDTLQGSQTQVATFGQIGAVQKVTATSAGIYFLNAAGQIYAMDTEMTVEPSLYYTFSEAYNAIDLAGDTQGNVYVLDQNGKIYTFRSGLVATDLSLVEFANLNQYVTGSSPQAMESQSRAGVDILAISDATSGHLVALNLETREFDTITARALTNPAAVAHDDDGIIYAAQRNSADIAVIQDGTLQTTLQIAGVAEPSALAVSSMCMITPTSQTTANETPTCDSDPSLEGCITDVPTTIIEEDEEIIAVALEGDPVADVDTADDGDGISVGDFDPASSFGGTVEQAPLSVFVGGYVLNGASMCSLNGGDAVEANGADAGLIAVLLSCLGLIRLRVRQPRVNS